VALPEGASLRELVSVAAPGRYSRYPVHQSDSPDRLVDAVHVKDVLLSTVESKGSLKAEKTARDLRRDVLTIPENRHIDELLEEPPKAKSSMAVAIDEWGSCEGLFTLGGIVEEIVGGIREGFDDEEPVVKELEDGTYRMDARIPIGEVNETLGAGFEGQTSKPSAASCSASWATYRRSGMRSASAAILCAWTTETVPESLRSSSASRTRSRRARPRPAVNLAGV
jgi:magnesium and cobalt exporter, CNNM family